MKSPIHCGKATMIVHEGREVIGSGLYFAMKKFQCGKANITMHEGREVTSSELYCAVQKLTVARPA